MFTTTFTIIFTNTFTNSGSLQWERHASLSFSIPMMKERCGPQIFVMVFGKVFVNSWMCGPQQIHFLKKVTF